MMTVKTNYLFQSMMIFYKNYQKIIVPLFLGAFYLSSCSKEGGNGAIKDNSATSLELENDSNHLKNKENISNELNLSKESVWILGFDGVDPKKLKKWMNEGYLPNLKNIADDGIFLPLESTNPPQSPVAWASFATGTDPGGHGIYDFLKRNPKTYFPSISTSDVTSEKFDSLGNLEAKPKPISYRSGDSFWKLASDAGVKTLVFNVPYSFPVDVISNGATLSGLGTPDVRGTNSTFTYFSTEITSAQEQEGVPGGKLSKINGKNGSFSAVLVGPASNNVKSSLNVKFNLITAEKSVEISLGEKTQRVRVGKWSDWFEFSFELTPSYRVYATGRFFVESLSPLNIYMYPPNIDPDHEWVSISYPDGFASSLKKKFGAFKTVGWSHDTNALNAEKIGDSPWLDDVFETAEKNAEMGLYSLEKYEPQLFIWVETATDRVSHMFSRVTDSKSPRYNTSYNNGGNSKNSEISEDPILRSYKYMDNTVGKFFSKMPKNTTLFIISDHGFHTYRRGVHLNSWLVKEGYMKIKSGEKVGKSSNIFKSVDWESTTAYALGTGQIYLNLLGREGKGFVDSNSKIKIAKEIANKLENLKDPKTAENPISKVYIGSDIYKGKRVDDAPDLVVSFIDGYRTSWETMLGGIPEGLFADNTKKWSGDHAASNVSDTPGVIISNKKFSNQSPAIKDIANSTFSVLGLPMSTQFEGKSFISK